MKRTLFALLVTIFVTAPAMADQALAQKKNCMACHAVEKKVVGPAYKDVAKKYAGQNVEA
jgi:cytochrome c